MIDEITIDADRYIGMSDAVALSGLSQSDIENLLSYGILPGKKVGTHWYVSHKALMESRNESATEVDDSVSSKAHTEFMRDFKKEIPPEVSQEEEEERLIPAKAKSRARRRLAHATPVLAGIVALLAIGASVFQSPQLYAVAQHALQTVQAAAAAMSMMLVR